MRGVLRVLHRFRAICAHDFKTPCGKGFVAGDRFDAAVALCSSGRKRFVIMWSTEETLLFDKEQFDLQFRRFETCDL